MRGHFSHVGIVHAALDETRRALKEHARDFSHAAKKTAAGERWLADKIGAGSLRCSGMHCQDGKNEDLRRCAS